ncbi:hypothetical protein GGR50DRAFT_539495 [Xylaria sp. CBS 124048]|nr:hypothetical protein GGR50DRAFT_539495 [Xylaria sp. CBS 124048]
MLDLVMQPRRDNPPHRDSSGVWHESNKPPSQVPDRDSTRTQNEREPVSLPSLRETLPERYGSRWAPSSQIPPVQHAIALPRRPATPPGNPRQSSPDWPRETPPDYEYRGRPSDYSHETDPDYSGLPAPANPWGTIPDRTRGVSMANPYRAPLDYPHGTAGNYSHEASRTHSRETTQDYSHRPLPGYPLEVSRSQPHEAPRDYSHRSSSSFSHEPPQNHPQETARNYSRRTPPNYSHDAPQSHSHGTSQRSSYETTPDSHRADPLKRKRSIPEPSDPEQRSQEARLFPGARPAWPWPMSQATAPESIRSSAPEDRPDSGIRSAHTSLPVRNRQHEQAGSLSYILSPTSSGSNEQRVERTENPRRTTLPSLPMPSFEASRTRAPSDRAGDSYAVPPRHSSSSGGPGGSAYNMEHAGPKYWESTPGGSFPNGGFQPTPGPGGPGGVGPGMGASFMTTGPFMPYYQHKIIPPRVYGTTATVTTTAGGNSSGSGGGGGGGGGSGSGSGSGGGGGHRRRRGNLPKETTEKLRAWFVDHLQHPYPTEDEKQELMRQTNLQMNQISNWFINARRRRLPALISNAQAESAATHSRSRDDDRDSEDSTEEPEEPENEA